MKRNYYIISLGVNCLPRTVLTRGGLKPAKAEGELSCPFDLAYHLLPNIIRYLETNFEDYFSDLYFEIRKRNFFDFRKKGLWQKKDGTKFFHDKDCKIGDRDKLVSRMKNRINNFYTIINSDVPILFVLNIHSNPEYIENLICILEKLCSGKKYKLAILDFFNLVNSAYKNTEILKIPPPVNNFGSNWNRKKYRNSDLGKYVEKCICQFIQNIINNEFI